MVKRDPASDCDAPFFSLPSFFLQQREKRRSILSASGEKNLESDKAIADEQQSWDSFKTMTTVPSSSSGGQKKDRVELHSKAWDASSANTPDTSEGDFQTEV
ncbi:adhesion G protein-coupled receptor B2 [Tachysurus ichikawai]